MRQEKCCPRLEIAKWDKKEIEWKDKPFLTNFPHTADSLLRG